MSKPEITLSSETIYRGKMLTLNVDQIELPNKKTAVREVITHGGAVGVIAVTKNQEIVLVKQYRHATGDFLLEIPAGKLEEGESVCECAVRELQEETGYIANDLLPGPCFYSSPGYSSEKLYLVTALNITKGEKKGGDFDEFVDVVLVPMDKAIHMFHEIQDGKTLIGVYYVAMSLGYLKE